MKRSKTQRSWILFQSIQATTALRETLRVAGVRPGRGDRHFCIGIVFQSQILFEFFYKPILRGGLRRSPRRRDPGRGHQQPATPPLLHRGALLRRSSNFHLPSAGFRWVLVWISTTGGGLARRGDRRVLTAAEFQELSAVPLEAEWFANVDNPRTRRAYRIDIHEFMGFVGIETPEAFRVVTRAQVLAWRRDLEGRELAAGQPSGASSRHSPRSSSTRERGDAQPGEGGEAPQGGELPLHPGTAELVMFTPTRFA